MDEMRRDAMWWDVMGRWQGVCTRNQLSSDSAMWDARCPMPITDVRCEMWDISGMRCAVSNVQWRDEQQQILNFPPVIQSISCRGSICAGVSSLSGQRGKISPHGWQTGDEMEMIFFSFLLPFSFSSAHNSVPCSRRFLHAITGLLTSWLYYLFAG